MGLFDRKEDANIFDGCYLADNVLEAIKAVSDNEGGKSTYYNNPNYNSLNGLYIYTSAEATTTSDTELKKRLEQVLRAIEGQHTYFSELVASGAISANELMNIPIPNGRPLLSGRDFNNLMGFLDGQITSKQLNPEDESEAEKNLATLSEIQNRDSFGIMEVSSSKELKQTANKLQQQLKSARGKVLDAFDISSLAGCMQFANWIKFLRTQPHKYREILSKNAELIATFETRLENQINSRNQNQLELTNLTKNKEESNDLNIPTEALNIPTTNYLSRRDAGSYVKFREDVIKALGVGYEGTSLLLGIEPKANFEVIWQEKTDSLKDRLVSAKADAEKYLSRGPIAIATELGQQSRTLVNEVSQIANAFNGESPDAVQSLKPASRQKKQFSIFQGLGSAFGQVAVGFETSKSTFRAVKSGDQNAIPAREAELLRQNQKLSDLLFHKDETIIQNADVETQRINSELEIQIATLEEERRINTAKLEGLIQKQSNSESVSLADTEALENYRTIEKRIKAALVYLRKGTIVLASVGGTLGIGWHVLNQRYDLTPKPAPQQIENLAPIEKKKEGSHGNH